MYDFVNSIYWFCAYHSLTFFMLKHARRFLNLKLLSISNRWNTYFIIHTLSYILYHTYFIIHTLSYILYHIFFIIHSLSYILYHTFFIIHSLSYILYHTFFIIHSLSYILYLIVSHFAGHDCSIRLWNLEDKSCSQEITSHRKKHDESVHCVGFHLKRPYFASCGADAIAKVFV